jgi:hypothetical protein
LSTIFKIRFKKERDGIVKRCGNLGDWNLKLPPPLIMRASHQSGRNVARVDIVSRVDVRHVPKGDLAEHGCILAEIAGLMAK